VLLGKAKVGFSAQYAAWRSDKTAKIAAAINARIKRKAP